MVDSHIRMMYATGVNEEEIKSTENCFEIGFPLTYPGKKSQLV